MARRAKNLNISLEADKALAPSKAASKKDGERQARILTLRCRRTMNLIKLTLALTFFCACATNSHKGESKEFPACAMLHAVLNEVIHPADDDLHLGRACVEERASIAGKVWVDARIFDQDGKQMFPRECHLSEYIIRFGKAGEPKSPGDGVLIVSISAHGNSQSTFVAQMENQDWQSRPPNVYAPSHCGSVSGKITRGANGIEVSIIPAPASDLE